MKLYDENGLLVYVLTSPELQTLCEVADGLLQMAFILNDAELADEASQLAGLLSPLIKKLETRQ